MKLITIIALAFSASCFGAEPAKAVDGPLPIPAAHQEEISRAMIALQGAQLKAQSALGDAKDKAGAAVNVLAATQAEAAKYLASEEAKYNAVIDPFRKELHAESCPGNPSVKPDLTPEKTWSCPAPAPTPIAPKTPK